MRTRLIRLRFRRRFRKKQQQVGELSSQAEQHIDRHFFKRFERLLPIKRFLATWLGLMILVIGGLIAQNLLLSSHYQTLRSVPGGIYNEGVYGRFTNANPLYATSDADTTVSRLIFAGLFTYDEQGKLVGDLAESYSVDEHGNTYTVRLKPSLVWQDGQPLTSSDVLFTYQAIQNPDARSPLQSSWQGITVTAPDPRTIAFKLPGGLASFPYTMTNGIVPRHLLSKVPVADLRSADFNTVHPIGAGPFAWRAIHVTGDGDPKNAGQQIALKPFAQYQGGAPKLQEFEVQIFANKSQLTKAFADNQLKAIEGLNALPKELSNDRSVIQNNLTLRAANMVFFKTSSGVLAEQPVRQSLVQAANVPKIIKHLGYTTRAVREPFLLGQFGYDPSLAQPGFDLRAARALLESNGWKLNNKGLRAKSGQALAFTLTAPSTTEGRYVSYQLQKQWQALGVKLNLQFLDTVEFQSALTFHSYEAILNGISIGIDPDVFVYWDSSQADIRSANRLNFSEYKNPAADAALESGRTRLDPTLRLIKYRPFLEAWQRDTPALGLYQPRLLYITHGAISGLDDRPLTTPSDRFANVHNWQIRQARVTN
ncbi:MAG: peptide ABC transporter substrate-binding protein [Patescibacteria group bacterium]